MSFLSYIKDHLIYVLTTVCTAGFCALLLFAVNSDPYFIWFIPCVLLFGQLAAFFSDYLKRRRYYNYLLGTANQMDRKYLLHELIGYPNFEEGKILYQLMKTTGKAMNDQIARYKNDSAEYREYIELWVHEIKTPIAGAKLLCENQQNKKILLELDDIERYVDQALFYCRSSAVEKDYVMKKVSLSELVSGTLRKNARLLIDNRVSPELENLSDTVFTDIKWTDFILSQLLNNSVKYKKSNTTIKFYGKKNENSVSLFLQDNGIGIPSKDIGRVFEKGFTGENGRLYGKSTGIGLYLCKKLCDRLGLGIRVYSQDGTTVELTFPLSNMFG